MATKKYRFQQTADMLDSETIDAYQESYNRKREEVQREVKRDSELVRMLITTGVLTVGAVVLIAFLIGLIGNLHQYIETSSQVMKFLLEWVPRGLGVAAVAWLFVRFYRAFRAWQSHNKQMKLMQAEIDDRHAARERENLLARGQYELMMAEARQKDRAITFDQLGNAAVLNPSTWEIAQIRGNYQQYPSLHTIRNDNQLQAGQADALQVNISEERSLPRIEQFYEAIPFNSLQTGLGAEVDTGELVIGPIRKSTHFKFIGGSGQGKSCVAGGVLDIATTTNDPDHLRIGLLDLEYNTARLFEDLPHVAEIGPRRQRLVGRDPDEVANKLKLLQWELTRRAQLGEEHCTLNEPVLLVYVEEMLSLKYEVVDKQLQKDMLAALNIISIRGRKYGIFFLTCMQTDYSDKSTREGMAQFRTRGGFAIDPDTARAAGFFKTELIKQNFQRGRQGQYVLEKPQYAGLVLAPDYDVALKLEAKSKGKTSATKPTMAPTIESTISRYDERETPVYEVASIPTTPTTKGPITGALKPQLTAQEWRIVEKWKQGMGMKQIIASEFSNGKGEPLQGGDAFAKKAAEIQQLIGRFLPANDR
ncbi:hypothetical protein [Ktedonospora formicarum]|uniref:FtsK domain-containing protein n=1 Tax=Ktedonospora formicarum TaxID=2778364 RepID=A0A8J3I8M8_9CHLR|nr:hypothetical protein [Ktedonospora formicarum]GHO51509.1 hypothetical protein KSX_96720 [Ktedonospora formicarum]